VAEIVWIIVIGSAIWVGIDASTHGVRKGLTSGAFDMGPMGWFLACLLLWIVAFPAYVAKRAQLHSAATSSAVSNPVQPNVIGRYCTMCGRAAPAPPAKYCAHCSAALI
jgi:hypothetical protein